MKNLIGTVAAYLFLALVVAFMVVNSDAAWEWAVPLVLGTAVAAFIVWKRYRKEA